jgi:hypothetical protein
MTSLSLCRNPSLTKEIESAAVGLGAKKIHLGAVPAARDFYRARGYRGDDVMVKVLTSHLTE